MERKRKESMGIWRENENRVWVYGEKTKTEYGYGEKTKTEYGHMERKRKQSMGMGRKRKQSIWLKTGRKTRLGEGRERTTVRNLPEKVRKRRSCARFRWGRMRKMEFFWVLLFIENWVIFWPDPVRVAQTNYAKPSSFFLTFLYQELVPDIKHGKNEPEQGRGTFGCGKHVGTDNPTCWDSFLSTLITKTQTIVI